MPPPQNDHQAEAGAERGAPDDVLGRRIVAGLVDIVVLTVLFTLVGVVSGEADTEGARAAIDLEGGTALLYFLLVLIYYFAGEAASGQTPGKRLLGLRVVDQRGGSAGVLPIAVRTILRIVDSLPILYGVALVVILATGQRRQRIGDLAAGTSVVRA